MKVERAVALKGYAGRQGVRDDNMGDFDQKTYLICTRGRNKNYAIEIVPRKPYTSNDN